MPRPSVTEYASTHAGYIDLVPDGDILRILEDELAEVATLLGPVTEAQGNTRHPPYTWSVKQVLGHLIDCERIMTYRALRFARGDATELPGFDEVTYAELADSDTFRLRDLVAEFESVRRSTVWFLRNLPAKAWERTGIANGNHVSVRALAYISAGHFRHHANILHRRLAGSSA